MTDTTHQPEKYTHAWAETKRRTCKLCQRTPFWCKRHFPRATMSATTLYTQNQVNQLLAKQLDEVREAIEMTPETFEVKSDGEVLEIKKGISNYKNDLFQTLKTLRKNYATNQ